MSWTQQVEQFDWATTPLGPRTDWPTGLWVMVQLILESDTPMILLWGPQLIQIYNEGYAVILGPRHPGALGRPTREVWPEVWHFNAPLYQGVRRGETFSFKDQPLTIERHGQPEEAYFTLCYSPARSSQGLVEGVLVTVTETTGRLQAQRLLQAQKEAAERRSEALRTFERWGQDPQLAADPYALTVQAGRLLRDLLPVEVQLYTEEDGQWTPRRLEEEPDALQPPVADELAGRLRQVWDRRETVCLSGTAADQMKEARVWDCSTALPEAAGVWMPLAGLGQRGVLVLQQAGELTWTPEDCGLLETVLHSLRLALDRAQNLRALAEEQETLRATNTELAALNGELEAFAYSVSHDLRTPVRHVQGFTDLLERSLPEPGVQTLRYLGVIRQAAGRMNTLIDAMLLLSKAGRVELRLGSVSLAALVAQAQRDAAMEFPEVEVQWRLGVLPDVHGDHDTLQQVMTNLLSNAVKYSGKGQAVVEVWGEARAREVRVHVRDHGAGFDPKYSARLFGVFQRLHRNEDFAGTGVGLATVRRIIQRHGGQVFAEGAPGQGATFSFCLPR